MFDIDGSHIIQLNDSDLRTLVALLCEAELRRAGLPISAITAGGDQNAADAGIDVHVELPPATNLNGFILRPSTGFQVKVPDMPASAILKEMRPGGNLRPALHDLASNAGAYIIVSANGSTSFSALRDRRKAMREAVADAPDSDKLVLDFYDRTRLASWVRAYPGLVAWVRERIGQPVQGWQPYASWAAPHESPDAEYLLDGKRRLYDWRSLQDGPFPILEGIQRIRGELIKQKGCVRLVGLSGTGKTRLTQALFDGRVGDQALDPAIAIYTDLGEQPEPSPRDLMRLLIQNRQRAIIIADNCLPETHRTLAAICMERESSLSLITIEFDVGEDDPEGTEVFRLDPSSIEVIEGVLKRFAPQLSEVDRRQVAEFAGGNARIALALAHTIRRGESVANLTNKALFNRLFHQGQSHDQGLLRAAEACSLLYSFNGEDLQGEAAELPFLAEFVGLTAQQLYGYIAELRSRDLIQRRGKWRAVLPQALANRLARQLLNRIPPQITEAAFLQASERLLRSFSRRLGYLHDCEAARVIVQKWLSNGGVLSGLAELSDLETLIFRNVAPVAPQAALEAMERIADGEKAGDFLRISNHRRSDWIYLLRSFSFEADLFQRAALLLARFISAEPPDYRYDSAKEPFISLFQIFLSGTHASIHQRLQVIDTLIRSDDERSQLFGLDALEELLKTSHFVSAYGFEFGARPRDYGWQPKTMADIITWYGAAVLYAQGIALSNDPHSNRAKSILASHFRDLWTHGGLINELESVVYALAERGSWTDGWISICDTIRSDTKGMSPDNAIRLRTLEEIIRPGDLIEQARAYVFSQGWSSIGLHEGTADENREFSTSAMAHANAATENLGREIATRLDVLEALLPDLVQGEVGRKWYFGGGLAAGAEQLRDIWGRLVEALVVTPENKRDVWVLRGFLYTAAARDPDTTAVLLDSAINHPALGPWFPLLQTSIDIDERGAGRLEESIQLGLAPSWTYKYLALGRATAPIPGSTLKNLLLRIASLPKGFEVAVDVLAMRIHSAQHNGASLSSEIVQCGRELMRLCPFDERPGQTVEYELGVVVDACFQGNDSAIDAQFLCRQLASAFSKYQAHAFEYRNLLTSLFRTHPVVALDQFISAQAGTEFAHLKDDLGFRRMNPVDVVANETLIAWAQVDPQVRFPQLASAIAPFMKNDAGELDWAPIALDILSLAPDPIPVLNEYSRDLRRKSWSGSLADILQSRRVLLSKFMADPDLRIATWAREQDSFLGRLAEQERSVEIREEDESFE